MTQNQLKALIATPTPQVAEELSKRLHTLANWLQFAKYECEHIIIDFSHYTTEDLLVDLISRVEEPLGFVLEDILECVQHNNYKPFLIYRPWV